MTPIELALMVGHFVRTRWGLRFADRAGLKRHQRRMLARFIRTELPRTGFYRAHAGAALDQLPIVDKGVALAHFDQMNAAGITLAQATAVALDGEASRDFGPSLGGVTVGLSSGTSGTRGVFMAAARERARWAGIMLARVLPHGMLGELVLRRAPLRVAFFLRANSNLYTTLKSRRIDFRFYDLFAGLDGHLPALASQQPEILVAPSRVLGKLAQLVLAGGLELAPRRVVAVAEVLEPDDRAVIERAFGQPVHQLYQCTEGFLGYTCEHGTLHLNEEFVHIEPEWLDAARTRFIPILTDFSRTTQLVVRYRLNDILRVRPTPCPCGRVSLALDAIDGRSDDILYANKADVYPDMVRHAITTAAAALPDYRIEQHGTTLRIGVADGQAQSYRAVTDALAGLFARLGCDAPAFEMVPFEEAALHAKRRRIVCITRPDAREAACAAS